MNNPEIQVYLVYTTAPDQACAEKIAGELLNHKLIACANIFPTGQSMYWWEGQIQKSNESVLILKTTNDQLKQMKEKFLALHPFEVPCFVVLPINVGHEDFLDWIRAETKGQQ